MKIVFVSVVLNIHQVGVSDELFKLSNGDFHFIQTGNDQASNLKGGGENYNTRPYIIKAASENRELITRLIREADVMIYGAAPLQYLKTRVKTGKLTFLYSERWLKRGLLNLLSPRLIKQQLFYHLYCHGKPVYALCSSAYAAKDFKLLNSFRNKYFKWGYFTAVPDFDINKSLTAKSQDKKIKILWVARFIPFKHPEVMVELGKALAEMGYDFSIDMYGTGEPLKSSVKKLVATNGLESTFSFPESLPNEELVVKMRDYHIFCFTSDRMEGWGAVLGEAMAAGCCPVSSRECGSTPFLVNDGDNGFSFDLSKKEDLTEKVKWLIDNPDKRGQMSLKAHETMKKIWNPTVAAQNLYKLASGLLSDSDVEILEGPCSQAEIL